VPHIGSAFTSTTPDPGISKVTIGFPKENASINTTPNASAFVRLGKKNRLDLSNNCFLVKSDIAPIRKTFLHKFSLEISFLIDSYNGPTPAITNIRSSGILSNSVFCKNSIYPLYETKRPKLKAILKPVGSDSNVERSSQLESAVSIRERGKSIPNGTTFALFSSKFRRNVELA